MGNAGPRRAVFLDRDGVLNEAVVRGGRPFPPAALGDVAILPGVPESCASLKQAGALLFCVTNQPDVARRTARRDAVEAINHHLGETLGLDAVAACFHDDADNCVCRKPGPGMILELAARFRVDPALSVMVGDRWRDVEAGRRAGCRTVFIDRGYDERQPGGADLRCASLRDATPWIIDLFSREEPQWTSPA